MRTFHALLNRHWTSYLIERGMAIYRESNRLPVPYFPDGLVANNTVHFTDEFGVSRRRIVVGCSAKRNAFWHLAPTCNFVTTDELALSIRMRVLFSEDGKGQWLSSDRMARVRRSFCKNWWNDRWRSLQQALLSWLSADLSEICIHVGQGGQLSLESKSIPYNCDWSIDEERLAELSEAGEISQQANEREDSDEWSAIDELLDKELDGGVGG